MEDSIRKIYSDLSKSDRKIFREMTMKRFNLSEDSVYNRIGGIRASFSIVEETTILNWFEKKEKYCIKRNEETLSLIGITQKQDFIMV